MFEIKNYSVIGDDLILYAGSNVTRISLRDHPLKDFSMLSSNGPHCFAFLVFYFWSLVHTLALKAWFYYWISANFGNCCFLWKGLDNGNQDIWKAFKKL